jgi:hypothetical protein
MATWNHMRAASPSLWSNAAAAATHKAIETQLQQPLAQAQEPAKHTTAAAT